MVRRYKLFEEYIKSDYIYIARQSENIERDIERNWSSWNFGKEGFEGTEEELDAYLNMATESNPVFISGWEIFKSQLDEFTFGELYDNYWVAIDTRFGKNGLSGIELNSTNKEDAIDEAKARNDYFCDGIKFNPNEYNLIYTDGWVNVFEKI